MKNTVKMNGNKIIITGILETHTKELLCLKKMVQEVCAQLLVGKDLEITLQIGADVKLAIMDGLFQLGINSCDVTITVGKESKIVYQFDCRQCCCEDRSVEQQVLRKRVAINLEASGAQASVRGVYFGDGERRLSLQTIQNHTCSDTKSEVIVQSVLDDQAQFSCDTVITIPKDVKKVRAKQLNKNLLLNSDVCAISVPQLAIASKDVSCIHGTVMSTIDQEELFYLQSRGLSEQAATKSLINAFLK